jgi:DNA-binding transcriptional MerR regulator
VSGARYKMKDLCALTGLERQVIHFYIHEGLLPEGEKTGRNQAVYGDVHLSRIRLIRQLQHERFLPLKAIKAMLDEQERIFSPAQRRLLREVKGRLQGAVRPRHGKQKTVAVAPLLAAAKIDPSDLTELEAAGLLATTTDPQGRTRIASDDAWILETWGELRAAGFTRELGFTPKDLSFLQEGVDAIFAREAKLLAKRLSHLEPGALAALVERALPIINAWLTRYHEAKVRNFFGTMDDPSAT